MNYTMLLFGAFYFGSSCQHAETPEPVQSLVYAGPSAYSCLAALPGGRIGLFFEAGEHHPYEKMGFVSFAPEELYQSGVLLGEHLP